MTFLEPFTHPKIRGTFDPTKEYKWGYRFAPGGNQFGILERIEEFVLFQRIISEQLGNDYEAYEGNLLRLSDDWHCSKSTINIRTNNDSLDIVYIKIMTNFDLIKKINFKDELPACLERQRLIAEYDEEHIDQTITRMKRSFIYRKSFGAKTPQLN